MKELKRHGQAGMREQDDRETSPGHAKADYLWYQVSDTAYDQSAMEASPMLTCSPQEAQEALNRRFSRMDMDNHVNAMLFSLAQRFFGKFLDITEAPQEGFTPLPNAVELMQLRAQIDLLPLNTLKERIGLPSLPSIIPRLQQAMEEGASSDRLAEILSPDPKLTAAIMSIANSPIYRQSRQVETLDRAITVLGTREISSIALGARILAMFEDAPGQGLPLLVFWKHSIATALMAYELAVHLKRDEPGKYLVAGLLHDLGQAMLFSRYPEHSRLVFTLEAEMDLPLREAEKRIYGLDHCLIGSIFMSEWNLPTVVVQSSLHHHDPVLSMANGVSEVVFVANQVVSAVGLGCTAHYDQEPGEELWDHLQLSLEDVAGLMEKVASRLWPMLYSLFPGRWHQPS